MKSSLKLMAIHYTLLEQSADILEIIEERYQEISDPLISDDRKNQLKTIYKHTQGLIRNLSEDLHNLIKLITEEKELEKGEE